MPGKPRETSFPKKTFTIKDGLGLNSERDRRNPALSSYRQFHRQHVLLVGSKSSIAAVTYFLLHQHVSANVR